MTYNVTGDSVAQSSLVSAELQSKIQKVLRSRNLNRQVVADGSTFEKRQTAELSSLRSAREERTGLSDPSREPKISEDDFVSSGQGKPRETRNAEAFPRANVGEAGLALLFALAERGPTARTWQRWQRWRRRFCHEEPLWRIERPYQDGSFRVLLSEPNSILHPDGRPRTFPNLTTVESQLLRDLQFALLGYPPNAKVVIAVALANGASSFGSRYLLRSVVYGIKLPTGLHSLAQSILDAATSLSILRGFAESCSFYNQGMVRQAMGAALADILRRFDAFFIRKWRWTEAGLLGSENIDALADGSLLTIQRLWLHLQPMESTIRVLASACSMESIRTLRGGALLGALHDLVEHGQGQWNSSEPSQPALDDPEAMTGALFWAAFQPFWNMLQRWIDEGELVDPYDEFCIQQDPAQRGERLADDFNAAYWERAYTLRALHLPRLLAPLATSILLAGKYRLAAESMTAIDWQVEKTDIRECSCAADALATMVEKTAMDQQLQFSFQQITTRITNAFATASQALLRTMIDDVDLIRTLQQFKSWFLLNRADFLDDLFTAMPADLLTERCTPTDFVDSSRTFESQQARLDEAMRGVRNGSDMVLASRAGQFSLTLLSYSLSSQLLRVLAVSGTFAPWSSTEAAELASMTHPNCTRDLQLRVMDAMALDYHAHWPFSLLLNRRVITKFQLLFRQLLSLHLCLHRLQAIWIQLQRAPIQNSGATNDARGAGSMLPLYCMQLEQTVKALLYSMTWGTIEPNWMQWQQALERLRASLQSQDSTLPQRQQPRSQDASIDALISALHEFLDACLQGCFLTKVRSFRSVRQIITLVHRLAVSRPFLPNDLDPERIASDRRTLHAAVKSLVQSVEHTHPLRAWFESSMALQRADFPAGQECP
jgi:hypothetical protein